MGAYHYLYYGAHASYFDKSGWQISEDGFAYYLDYYGQPLNGWQQIDGNRYYFDPQNNFARYTGWLEMNDRLYYFDEEGVQQSGIVEIMDERYLLDEFGTIQTGWYTADGVEYYLADRGEITTGWLKLQEATYYLDENGSKVVGVETIGGTEFYFDEAGALYIGWLESEEGYFYYDENGCNKGWLTLGDQVYYLNEFGVRVCGWQIINQKHYIFDDEGVMVTGWLFVDNDRYYFLPDGTMAVGHILIEDMDYFFDSTGKGFYLVNREYAVPDDAVPDLVDVEGYLVDVSCEIALKAMMQDCRDAGYSCYINSAYRSFETQSELFAKRVNNYIEEGYSVQAAYNLTGESVLPAGTSEHQLGLAIDLGGSEGVYAWLEEYAPEYGFILRYPADKTHITGIMYEPWHFRYLGVELAQELDLLNVTLEEYVLMLTHE